jgi:hypothetical protein
MDLWYFARRGLIRRRCVHSLTSCGPPGRVRSSEGANLLRTLLSVVALVASAVVIGSTPSATATPMVRSPIAPAEYATNVSIVCEQDGRCYRRGGYLSRIGFMGNALFIRAPMWARVTMAGRQATGIGGRSGTPLNLVGVAEKFWSVLCRTV